MRTVDFNEGDQKWFIGHHKYIDDRPIMANSVPQALRLFEEYIREECSDNTYTSDIIGIEEVSYECARKTNWFYITED